MTLERWYRQAAIFLWPERRHFEIICDRESRKVVPVLNQLVARWQQSHTEDAAALKTQCLDLASAILAKWSENRYAQAHPQEPITDDLLKTLAALDEPRLIGDFLGSVMIKDAAIDPGKSLGVLCQTYGWGTFQQELLTLMKSTTNETMERNVRLLEHLCSAKPRKKVGWCELCALLAQELVLAVEEIDQKPSSTDWSSRQVNRAEVLAGLARSLIVTEQFELLSCVVTHALSSPKKYPLTLAPAGVGEPSALAREECQKEQCCVDAVGRLMPRAIGISHGSSPSGTPRLPAHGRDHLQVSGLRRAETIPGGSS